MTSTTISIFKHMYILSCNLHYILHLPWKRCDVNLKNPCRCCIYKLNSHNIKQFGSSLAHATSQEHTSQRSLLYEERDDKTNHEATAIYCIWNKVASRVDQLPLVHVRSFTYKYIFIPYDDYIKLCRSVSAY